MIKNNNNSIGIDNRVSLPFPFATNRAFPLDSRSFFSDFIEAQEKVRDAVPLLRYGNVFELPAEIDAENQEHGTDDWYYYGQPVVVYNNDTGQSDLYLVVRRIDETTGEPYGDLRLVCDSLDTQYLSLDDASAYITQVILQWVGENLNTEDRITGYLFTCATDDCENNIPLNGLYAFGLKEEGGIIGLCDDYNQILWFDPETVYDRNTNQLATLESINNRISNARVVFKNCNGAVVGSFTLNQASEQDIVITLPSGGGGTSNYEGLENKPSINGVELSGNLTNEDLHIGSVKIEYQDLVTLRDNGELVPGTQYRITNYQCTTTQENTKSAEHAFDVIVRADDESHLNENAFAAHHEGDEYFVNCKLESWELKYCLDNDTNRFAWASNAQIYNSSNIERIKVPYDELLNELKLLIVSEGLDYSDDDCAFYFDESMHSGNRAYYFSHDGGASLNLDFGVFLKGNTEYSIGNTVVMESQIGQGDPINVTLSEINNDTNVAGKGVVYYMKDEWNNECPYDFKNIMFKRWAIQECENCPSLVVDSEDNTDGYYYGAKMLNGDNVLENATYGEDSDWFYTFALKDLASEEWYDYTVVAHLGLKNDEGVEVTCYNNHIVEDTDEYSSGKGEMAKMLNNIVFFNCYGDLSDTSYSDDYSYCNNNRFLGNCQSNSFGNYCQSNSFGNNCGGNTFGNNCVRNTFGNYCQSNSFGNNCSRNSFGNECPYNSFGNNCEGNTFGNYCTWNSFGNNFQNNSVGNNSYSNTFGNYCRDITVFDCVQNCSVTGGTDQAPVKNAQILNGTAGASSANKLTITFAANKAYTQVAAKNTQGNLVIYNPADSAS